MPLNLEMLNAFTVPGPDGKLPTLSVNELQKLAPANPDAWKADLLFLAKEGGLNIVQGKRDQAGGDMARVFWIQKATAAAPSPTAAPPVPKPAGQLAGAPGGTIARMSPAAPGPRVEGPAPSAGGMAIGGPGMCAIQLKALRISSSGGRTKLTASPAFQKDAHALLEFSSFGAGESSEIIFATLTRQLPGKPQGNPKEAPAAGAQALPAAGSGADPGETAAGPEIEPPEANFEAAEDLEEFAFPGGVELDPGVRTVTEAPGKSAEDKPRRKTPEEISREMEELDIPSSVRAATIGMMSAGPGGENKAKGNI